MPKIVTLTGELKEIHVAFSPFRASVVYALVSGDGQIVVTRSIDITSRMGEAMRNNLAKLLTAQEMEG